VRVGTLAQQEAERAARDSHHNNAIDLTGDDFDTYDFDLGDDVEIVGDGPSTSGPHASRPGSSLASRNLLSGSAPATTPRPRISIPRPNHDPTRQQRGPANNCWVIMDLSDMHTDKPSAISAVRCLPYYAVSKSSGKCRWTCGVCGEEVWVTTFGHVDSAVREDREYTWMISLVTFRQQFISASCIYRLYIRSAIEI